MDKQSIHGDSRFKRFINGRGFYAALAVCLIAAGGIAAATFGEKLFVKQPTEEEPSAILQQVERPVSDEPDTRKTTTTTSEVKATTSTAKKVTATTAAADLYILPFGNAVQKAYSGDAPAYSVTMGDWRTHSGTDFEGEMSAPVKALADGTVTDVSQDPMWGETVTVDHGVGVISRYCGVHASVAAGDRVKVGSIIGQLTEIPCESAQKPHLHLELTIDGRTVDPVNAIGREVRYTETADATSK